MALVVSGKQKSETKIIVLFKKKVYVSRDPFHNDVRHLYNNLGTFVDVFWWGESARKDYFAACFPATNSMQAQYWINFKKCFYNYSLGYKNVRK